MKASAAAPDFASAAVPPTGDADALVLAGVDRMLRFDTIYEAHFAFVWRNLRRFGVPVENLDDAAQDVFLVVHRRLDQYDGSSTVTTWLFGITIRVARDYRRRIARKGGAIELRDDAVAPHAVDPFDQAASREGGRILEGLLSALDEEKRAVFVLAELEQMSGSEIAEALGVNVNTVYSRLRVARERFHEAAERLRARGRGRIG